MQLEFGVTIYNASIYFIQSCHKLHIDLQSIYNVNISKPVKL